MQLRTFEFKGITYEVIPPRDKDGWNYTQIRSLFGENPLNKIAEDLYDDLRDVPDIHLNDYYVNKWKQLIKHALEKAKYAR